VSATLGELLRFLGAAVRRGVDVSTMVAAIEALVEDDPEACRTEIYAFDGDDITRLWALGLVGDPRYVDVLTARLADPTLRFTALEALANQTCSDRVDTLARSLLHDPDPNVRSKAVGVVAFGARPGVLDALLSLAEDPDPQVRMQLAWHLGGLHDPAATLALRRLLTDSDESVRRFADRGLTRLEAAGRGPRPATRPAIS
jgi:HEAT repeat protein